MKSYLPIFLLVGGLLVVSLVGFAVFNLRSRETPVENKEEVVPSVPAPFVTLTPDSAGRELTLNVSKIDQTVASLEYELVYNTQANVLQGVPGTVDVTGQTSISRQLTLGTCSSGVCRYDKGVKDITLTIRLRNKSGKLLNKFSSGVALSTKEKKLTSADGKFTFALDKTPVGYYVVTQTGAVPSDPPGELTSGPYGVFTSGGTLQSGTVTLTGGKIYLWDGKAWQELSNGKTKTLGTFVTVKE